MVPPGGAGIGMHVIPVEKAIETENKSVSIEHISHWLKKYDGVYAASPCSCRMSRAKLGEGCGDDPQDWCIAVGDMARYVVETDRGHYITYDEVLKRHLAVMDSTATSLSMDNHIPVLVFALKDPYNIVRVLRGEKIGTIVKEA